MDIASLSLKNFHTFPFLCRFVAFVRPLLAH
jgi:hypothetical protein